MHVIKRTHYLSAAVICRYTFMVSTLKCKCSHNNWALVSIGQESVCPMPIPNEQNQYLKNIKDVL